nr:carbonic anhydrase 9 isoform X1 [Zootoca vivipara]XP_034956761.1 carbonic anhydrase 9 isoform X1 [Zootoca vivipara]
MQSPINIETRAALFSPQLEPILLPDYSLPPREMLRLQNNGHTVVLEMPRNLTVTGGGFPQPYQAAQLHLHWGSDLKPGSEHTVDGHRYAGEIHVVYYSSRFDTIQEAQVEPGGLAVLAAFLQVGSEENKPYQHILEHLNEVHEEGEETWIPAFDVAKLLPDDLSRYFRYNGSLTTPPCYQTVNWTIFNQTIRLSPDQISVLEDTLHADEDELIQDNFRLPQSLQGRRVLASFPMLHSPERAQPPGEGASTRVPDPYGPAEEGGGNSAGSAAGGGQPLTPDGASGRDSEPASGEGMALWLVAMLPLLSPQAPFLLCSLPKTLLFMLGWPLPLPPWCLSGLSFGCGAQGAKIWAELHPIGCGPDVGLGGVLHNPPPLLPNLLPPFFPLLLFFGEQSNHSSSCQRRNE